MRWPAASPLLFFILRRFLQAIPALLLISLLSFVLLKVAPGDFLDQLQLDPTVGQEFIAQERTRLGLDKPIWQQYFIWLGNLLQGDFGRSYTYQIPALQLILSRVGATLLLAVSAFVLTWICALPLGILSALRQNTGLDRSLQLLSYTGQSIPSFVLAILLLILAQTTGWFPVGGMTSLNFASFSWGAKLVDLARHLILPTLALTITSFAGLQRITRGSFLDVMQQDYMQAARARGLPEWRLTLVHALRNAVNPLVTILGLEFAQLLSGSFIAEFFFSWPGLGKLILEAVRGYDVNVVMASLLMGAVMLIVGNLLADLMLQWMDPRIRTDLHL
ncbi:MAG: ABC transporter permease [Synechococcaceae cyanobacterium SM2_3_1]|nr:ABC transporter permease [Synechococcaceae cyanobacterium SM2_3_1]